MCTVLQSLNSKQLSPRRFFTFLRSYENCSIFYNFWSNGGNVNFAIQNNSEKNIYLNKKECFFVCNGYAYDYFQNRTYSTTKGIQVGGSVAKTATGAAGVSVSGVNVYGYNQTNSAAAANSYAFATGVANSVSNSVSWEEPEIICIRPKTTKVISEVEQITNTLFRNCKLYRYPTDRQTLSSIFSETESPLVFSNKLAYSLGDSKDLIRINNEFYVSEIKNLNENNIIERKYEEYCGEKNTSGYKNLYWKDATPDKFYLIYTKSNYSGNVKH